MLVCQGAPYAVTILLTVQSVLIVGIVDNPLTKIMESQKSIDNSQRGAIGRGKLNVKRLADNQCQYTGTGSIPGPGQHHPFGVRCRKFGL